jgi:hypothetical protein
VLGIINGNLTGFSAFVGSPLSHVLAYADYIQDPQIHIADWAGVDQSAFAYYGVLGLFDLEFSPDGQWLFNK